MKTSKVYDTTMLTQGKVYQIDGTFYRYRYRTDSILHPQFIFAPIGGQRKTAELSLNRNKVHTRVWLVEGVPLNVEAAGNKAIQLTLF